MIITIASSDKLTLAMFADFYKTLYNQDVLLLDFTCLYSTDILKSKIDDVKKISLTGRTVLIKYKIKIQTKEISVALLDSSDIVIKFDIYSTEPEIIKSEGTDTEAMLDRWKLNIQNLNNLKYFL
jgi:hypothetical protein